MLKPLGHRVLVKQEKLEEVDDVFARAHKAGIIWSDEHTKREQAAVDKGTVVAIGSTAWKDFGGDPWCAVGDNVYFARHAGRFLKDPNTGEEFTILNDEDIIAKVGE